VMLFWSTGRCIELGVMRATHTPDSKAT